MEVCYNLASNFLIALGVILGGSLIGSLSAVLLGRPPGAAMGELAWRLKIWAMVTALGGTFTPIRNLESSLLGGQFTIVLRQLLFILSSFAGAHIGYLLISTWVGGQK